MGNVKAILLALLVASAARGAAGIAAPVGWWKLDNDGAPLVAVDSSGSGIDGTLTNMDGTEWTPSGKAGGALEFDGTDDYVDLGNPSALQITGNQTICLWLRPDVLNKRQNPYAKAYGGEGTWTLEMNGTINYYYGSAGRNSSPYSSYAMSKALKVGQWAHVAVVRDLKSREVTWYRAPGNAIRSGRAMPSMLQKGAVRRGPRPRRVLLR